MHILTPTFQYILFLLKLLTNLAEASVDYVEDTSLVGAAEIEGVLTEFLDSNNQMFVHLLETSSGT